MITQRDKRRKIHLHSNSFKSMFCETILCKVILYIYIYIYMYIRLLYNQLLYIIIHLLFDTQHSSYTYLSPLYFSLLHIESFIRSEVNMASNMSYSPVLPRNYWSSRSLAEEYNFDEMVDLMWTGPLGNARPEELFGYVKL